MSRWLLWITAGIIVFFTAFGAVSFMDEAAPNVSPYEDTTGPRKAEPDAKAMMLNAATSKADGFSLLGSFIAQDDV